MRNQNALPILVSTAQGYRIVRADGSAAGAEAFAENRGYTNVCAIQYASDEDTKNYPEIEV